MASQQVETLFHASVACFRAGALDEAEQGFRACQRARPHDPAIAGMLVLTLLNAGAGGERLRNAIEAWSETHAPRGPGPALPMRAVDPVRRLQIAYLSADLRGHPVGFNLWPLLRCHDRSRFSVHLYSAVKQPDAMTTQLRALADSWCEVAGLKDHEIAARIAGDGIDILIVPAPHWDDNRAGVLRHRAAPIQIVSHETCSTGIPEADYFLGDFVSTPRSGGEWFFERVLRLPCFIAHPIPAELPPLGPPPSLRNGFVTFGSFNAPAKLQEATIALWSRVLHATPHSRLRLKHLDSYALPKTRDRVLAAFASHGIAAQRIDIVQHLQSRADHLGAYAEIDIALDSLPFNGVTTSFEALLMGVPVVTLRGDRMAGRTCASILGSAGLHAFIARDAAGYILCATALAHDPARLAVLRTTIRHRVRQSGLCHAERHTRCVERYLRAVWRRWCGEVSSSAATGTA